MTAATGYAPLRRRRRVRAGLTQVLFALVGLCLGFALARITGGPEMPARQVTDMLLALGFGLLGTIAVIFSLLFVVVQWAHTTFTPRLMLFREAPIVRRTFTFAVSLAVFCVTAALATGNRSKVSAVVPVVAVFLLLVMLALLRTLQLQAFAAIQLAPVLASITQRGRSILESLYALAADPAAVTAPLRPPSSTVTWAKPSTVLQQFDMDRLLAAARDANAVIILHRVPGTTLQRGTAVADVHGGEVPDSSVIEGLVVGNERTFEQDPTLAFRLLADITLRALSPAVNDPATAVQGLDCLEDLLGRSAVVQAGPVEVADSDGTVRVVIRLPGWGDFLRVALDDVMVAAVKSPMVLMRLRALLGRLRTQIHPGSRELVTRRLAWVEAELADRYPLVWREAAEDAVNGG